MRKIVIIEDEVIIARDIKQILTRNNFEVCGVFNGKKDPSKEILDINPDVIISDIFLKSNITGVDINKNVQSIKYIPLVFLTAYATEEIIATLAEIKNDGYIIKPFTEAQLLATVKLIIQKYCTKSSNPLSIRENEIANYIMVGLENKEIARIVSLSEHTIRTHRKNIYTKLQVNNVAQLIEKLSLME